MQWHGLGIELRAAIIVLGLQPRAITAAFRPIPMQYYYKQSLTLHICKTFYYNDQSIKTVSTIQKSE